MDGHRFDDWTRGLAASETRRYLLGGIASAALAALGAGRAGARSCRAGPGRTCREHADCCSGLCGASDGAGRRHCRCRRPRRPRKFRRSL
jgi:hypothetical protein